MNDTPTLEGFARQSEQSYDSRTIKRASNLNDDDFYVVDLRTLAIVHEFGCKSCDAIGMRSYGYKVHPGQALVKGMQLRWMVRDAVAALEEKVGI